MKIIEVFVLQGCVRCPDGLDELRETALSFGDAAVEWKECDLLANIDQAVEVGILSAPAIAIDGKLVFGSLPTPQQ
jgi:thioredoxin 1